MYVQECHRDEWMSLKMLLFMVSFSARKVMMSLLVQNVLQTFLQIFSELTYIRNLFAPFGSERQLFRA